MKASMTHQTAAKVAHDIYPELTERQAVCVYLTALAGSSVAANCLDISTKALSYNLERAREHLGFNSQSELRLTTLIRLVSMNHQVYAS